MNERPTELERAFALARSGECATVVDIRRRLAQEGYGVRQLEGPMLLRQLRQLCDEATSGLKSGGGDLAHE